MVKSFYCPDFFFFFSPQDTLQFSLHASAHPKLAKVLDLSRVHGLIPCIIQTVETTFGHSTVSVDVRIEIYVVSFIFEETKLMEEQIGNPPMKQKR